MKLVYVAALASLLLTGCASTGDMAPSLKATLKCDGPDFNEVNAQGKPVHDEETMARDAETILRMRGVAPGAHQTRWWNGCLQTFVSVDGHEVMKFYDPNTYKEVSLN